MEHTVITTAIVGVLPEDADFVDDIDEGRLRGSPLADGQAELMVDAVAQRVVGVRIQSIRSQVQLVLQARRWELSDLSGRPTCDSEFGAIAADVIAWVREITGARETAYGLNIELEVSPGSDVLAQKRILDATIDTERVSTLAGTALEGAEVKLIASEDDARLTFTFEPRQHAADTDLVFAKVNRHRDSEPHADAIDLKDDLCRTHERLVALTKSLLRLE